MWEELKVQGCESGREEIRGVVWEDQRGAIDELVLHVQC